MSTLEAELLQAAKRADQAAWLHDKRRNIAEYEEAVAESAALRARAAHARALLERAIKFRDNPNLPADNMIGPFVVSMLNELCGPLNPDSAGGTPTTREDGR